MCGIVGAVSPVAAGADWGAAIASLAHRGPDGQGTYLGGRVWLGHTRLAIIDLSEGAQQPMLDSCHGKLVFNGEIYDYRERRAELVQDGVSFSSSSDTEVLLRGLATKGLAFLRSVHGMYAFAWLEPNGRTLWLVRDPLGIKPLYLWAENGHVAFASEVRTVATAARQLGGLIRLSGDAVCDFLRWGCVEEPNTILLGIQALRAGYAVPVDVESGMLGEAVRVGNAPDSPCRSAEELRHSIERSVARHTVADTPVSLFLSGGVDSGVLAHEVSRLANKSIEAITVQLGSSKTADEVAIVQCYANRLGLPLHTVTLGDWKELLGGLFQAYDQPSIDGANTFLISQVARSLGFKVAISGLGADEVFGGYAHLGGRGQWTRGRFVSRHVAGVVGRQLGGLDDHRVRRVGILLEGHSLREPLQRSWRRRLSERTLAELLGGRYARPQPNLPADPLECERATYLKNMLLRDADVMGMANGVEIRVPFLDSEVIAAARSFGTDRILDPNQPSKWILKQQWGFALSNDTIQRRKTGFSLDLGAWLTSHAQHELRASYEIVMDSSLFERDVFSRWWEDSMQGLREALVGAWIQPYSAIQLAHQLSRWGDI